ncbi:hypothetical protein [Wolbachia endosymbiont of Oryzaephilus surinamensis]|uniref:hypothetical protein n=1 Tax=Wolbachia endosymbiont of Oryzaephilus surinamensis TaxID=573241 RepID=UPI0021D53B85|nr:hypothetical protein [Wolbachia endosymbiont of Oryzaephilus surinamensis]UXX40583.1 hypothetical protein MJ631_01055 [Wolbachia endosymbiont of Oryzaephilus surinamensis]
MQLENLSHDLAGLDKLESVYIYIWQWINRPARDHEELSYTFNAKAIKEAVLNDLYGLIKKEDIGKLGSELNEQQKNIIWECLVKAEVLDDQGKLLKENIDDNKLNEILLPEFSSYKDRLNYLLKECIEREKFIHVPNNLRPFIEQHLESWINNAITAFFMKAGEDYVVDVDRTGSSPDRNPNITILDRDTGTDQANSQWDEALHQFLQLKHGCKLSLQSLKAVFISNVSFFKLYSNLYGLTGTLGSQRERDLLQEIHEVDFVTIPTAKSKQFHEEKPILCTGKDEWIKRICNETKRLTEEKKRSILIICETVNDVETLYKAFGGKDAKHVHTYTRDYEEFDKGFKIVQGNKELGQGQIIIATNLAGRGTDIKITEELRKAGGLHVYLTYLPNNIRIEQQAFGRAARSGDQGSGQLIIIDSKGQEYSNLKILDLKKERDAEELHRISDIKAYYDTRITMEESCFKTFKEQYKQLKKNLNDKKVPTDVKEILLQSCLDKWAFWLDEHNKYIRDLKDEQDKRNLHNLLDKFISQLKNLDTRYNEKWLPSYDDGPSTPIIEHDSTSWLAWVEGDPVQMVKLGRYLSQNNEHKNAHESAIKLFDDVVTREPYFSEAAHYYKAFALAKKIDWEKIGEEDKQNLQEFKKELREATRFLDEHSKFAINAAGIIGEIKKNNNESIIQIDAYEEQQKSLANLYYMFSRSIDDIFGHTITPQSFVNYDIKEELAESLYKNLLEKGMLKKPRVKKSISEEELKVISAGYGVSVKTLKNFLSKHEGKEINEKEFQKALKKAVPLPSREAFWTLLIKKEVLSEKVKYVVVNNEKLKEINPSLLDHLTGKINQKELEKQTLELNNEQILLNAEWVTQQKNNGNIFKKDDFIKIVGKDKYKVLKERGVLSFNRKAHIDLSKIESMTFPCYDSITLEDFTKVNITTSEAEKILAELVERKVLEKKDDSENSAYGLKIKFDKIKQVQLSFCPVYENVVKGLLSTCFTYRIALQKIAVRLKEKKFPVRLQLITKPHQSLVLELLEQKIIKPTMVTTKDKDLEEKLKSIYSQKMTKDKFKCILSQSKLIPEKCVEELFDCLVEKGWIIKYDPIQSIQDEGIRAISKENIKNASASLLLDLYYISSPDKRQKPLSFSSEGSQENVLTTSQSIDKTVEKVLDNRLQLAKEDTIKNIVSTLKRSRSSLKALEVPDSKLKPLTEFSDQGVFGNIEEVHAFSLNGLDQLLQLEEKKWTREMLLNTAVVTAMGVSQIAIGTAIELYSVGIMTHVGAAFVNEGVNDLFFAASALKSGYFSWEDYGQHKLESLMMTAVTVGIGAYLSRGAKVSRFGHKLAGPNFEFGKKVAEMSGTQLIKTAGWKVVGKEVTKRITLKAIEGVALGLANAGVDTIIENYLQALCEGIASEILPNIEQEVEKHNISKSLGKAYKTLGEESARKMVSDLTESVFTEQNCVEKFLSIANKIVSSVTQGIAEAAEKRSKMGNNLELPIHTISKIVVWSERSTQIANITMITNNLLNNLDQEIKDRLNKSEKDVEQDQLSQKQETEKDYESFKKEVIDQWKSLLHEKAGRVISQHIVSPVLKEGANHLVRYVGKKMQEAYQSYKESGYLEYFEKQKQEYKEKLQSEQQCDNISKVENHITEKYHKILCKLLERTEDPKLIDDILEELDNSKNRGVQRSMEKLLKSVEEFINKPLKEAEKAKGKLEREIKRIIEKLDDEELKKYMNDKMEGKKDVKYTGQMRESDKGKLGGLIGKTKFSKTKRLLDMAIDELNKAKYLTACKPAFEKALKMEGSKEQHKHSSNISFYSNYVLKVKFEKDHSVETLPTYQEQRNYETIAAAEKDGVLYLACNYQVSKDSGKVDNKGKPIINTSEYGWGEDHIFITNKLEKMCRTKGIKRVFFIEPEEKPTNYTENRAPHAEMQLCAFAKQNGISFDYIDTSKPPCACCMGVMDNVGINYRERPGVNINPKNWKKPKDIKVKVVHTHEILETQEKRQNFQSLRFQQSSTSMKPMVRNMKPNATNVKNLPVSKKPQNFQEDADFQQISCSTESVTTSTTDNARAKVEFRGLQYIPNTSIDIESVHKFAQPRMRSQSF